MERKLLSLIAIAALAACTPISEDPVEPESTLSEEPSAPETEPTDNDPTQTEAPAPEQSSTDEASSDPTEAPAPEASDPVALPSCTGLVTTEELGTYFPDGTDSVEVLSVPNWGSPAEVLNDGDLSPLMERATDSKRCTWGIPDSGAFFTIIMGAVSPDLSDEVNAVIADRGYPDVHPPLRGVVAENPDALSVDVHLADPTLWLVFQGGEGSINADDAQRHGFAAILTRIADDLAP